MKKVTRIHNIFFTLTMTILSGCTMYHAKPLPTQPTFSTITNNQLTVPITQISSQQKKSHTMSLATGLDMTDIAILADINSPTLQLARDDSKVTKAQAFAAGLLPDPKIEGSQDFPILKPPPGSTTGYVIGPTYDYVSSLISYSANQAASSATQRQADLTLLWQEWQVITQAELLYVRNIMLQKQLVVLEKQQNLLQKNYQIVYTAVQSGNNTLDQADAQLGVLQDTERQINDTKQLYNQSQHDLNVLLGIAPEIKLPLNPHFNLPSLNQAEINASLKTWLAQRPDMLALKAGYESQDQQFRAAVLGQFPQIKLGVNRARGTDGLNSYGYTFSIDLPIFNGNRGNVAIAEATRQRLYDDYQQRLNTAYSDIELLLKQQQILAKQQLTLEQRLQSAQQLARVSITAYKQGNIDLKTYTIAQTNLLTAQMALLTSQQLMLEQRLSLQVLVGHNLSTRQKKS